MKKLILSELLLLFLATTFMTDSLPPGWFQQTLPVNDQINDIFFLDSLTGWVVTNGNYNANDTSYIMHTTDGGNNWVIQEKNREVLNVVQFLDANTGYAAGGVNGTVWCTILKTTNSGTNWVQLNNIGLPQITDIFFLNVDTGWACGNSPTFGGLWKTTDGAQNWDIELDQTYRPYRMSFINKDTGWVVGSSVNGTVLKTTNGGLNWNVIYNFTNNSLVDIYFINNDTGWGMGGGNPYIWKTTNSGINWVGETNPGVYGNAPKIFFINTNKGWAGTSFNNILATTNGGINWGNQYSPSFDSHTIFFTDTSKGWAGTTLLVHTIDGGGPVGIKQITGSIPEDFKLFQNFPNPFNPVTYINYELKITNYVVISVFDVTGKHIIDLVNQRQNAGSYKVTFDGSNYSSGVYFYSLIIDGKLIDTKRMILLK